MYSYGDKLVSRPLTSPGLARADGKWAADGGAIVALDPTDGSILAMASLPTYKPSVYSGRVEITGEVSEGGRLTLTYQACEEARCLPPVERGL